MLFHIFLLFITYIKGINAKTEPVNKWNLNDKIIVVTGGSKGIGQAIIDECLALNAKTVITCCRNREEMDQCK